MDTDLVTRAQGGDQEAFADLVYAVAARVLAWSHDRRLLSVDEPMVVDGTSAVVDRDQLERAFRRLSLNHRTVVVLHHYLDLPLDRVADIVGAPLGAGGAR